MKKLFYVLFLFLLLPAGSYSQQWVNKFNYSGSSKTESANIVLTDASANVYIIGNSVGGSATAYPYDNDIVVYKYNSAGTAQWTVTYSGLVGGKDTVTKAVIDGSGNIYLTGCTTVAQSDSTDVLTMMISSAGIILWTKTFKYEVGSHYDIGNDVFVDGSGNVFVTGQASGVELLLKYNNSGVLQFAKVKTGAQSEGRSIYVDASGNIFLGGSFVTVGFSVTQPLFSKYNSAGTNIWDNGIGIDGICGKVLADASGNSFFMIQTDFSGGRVVKFNSSGTLLFNNAAGSTSILDDMELDAFGNVYVCGADNNGAFIGVYTTSFGVIWTASVSSGASAIEFYSMLVDNSFNVYATGYFDSKTITSKYNSTGVKQWSVSETSAAGSAQGNSITLDNASSVLIAGSIDNAATGSDFYAVRYTTTGSHHWLRSINRLVSFNEVVTASEPDAAGNYYTVGYVNLGTNSYATQVGYGIIQKINSAGTVVWSKVDTAFSNIRYNDVAVDNSGNVYITGTSNEDCITNKYNSSGTLQWSKIFNGAGLGYDEGTSITLDGSGNVYLCGNSYQNASSGIDIVTIKYNSAGTFQWSQYISSTFANTDHAVRIKINSAGNVIVGGNNLATTNIDAVVFIYNASGSLITSIYTPGSAGGTDELTDLFLDASDNIYITGTLLQSGTNNDLFIKKIESTGFVDWISTYNSGANTNEKGFSVTTDKSGNVYACGYVINSGTNKDILTVKFSSAGVFQWAKQIINPTGGFNYANSISADTLGNTYITGRYFISGFYTLIAVKYNTSGNELVRLFYDGAGSGDCEGIAGYLNSAGDYIIAANVYENPQKQNIDLINFDRSSFAIKMKIVTGIEGLWNGTIQTRDSLKVYLRNSFAPYSKVDSAVAYLYTTCDDTVSFFTAPSASYYVSVSHRNSLETWSASTQPLSPGSYYTQNFTGNQTDAYGSNLIFYNSKWCIYSGDINKDGFINGNDFTLFSSQFGLNGYLGADLNNDGVVNGNDFTLFSSSFGKIALHP